MRWFVSGVRDVDCRALYGAVAFVCLGLPRPALAERCDAVCMNTAGACIEYEIDGEERAACVYLTNLHVSNVTQFQRRESETLYTERVESTRNAYFLATHSGRSTLSRFSNEGVLQVRAFRDGAPVPLHELGVQVEIRVGATPQRLGLGRSLSHEISMEPYVREAALGDPIEVVLWRGETVVASRRTWYRPRGGFFISYDLAAAGVTWADGFSGDVTYIVVPASLQLQYRFFLGPDIYIAPGISVGLSLTDPPPGEPGDARLSGITTQIVVDIIGLKIGFGFQCRWDGGQCAGVVSASVTATILAGLGLIDTDQHGWAPLGLQD